MCQHCGQHCLHNVPIVEKFPHCLHVVEFLSEQVDLVPELPILSEQLTGHNVRRHVVLIRDVRQEVWHHMTFLLQLLSQGLGEQNQWCV